AAAASPWARAVIPSLLSVMARPNLSSPSRNSSMLSSARGRARAYSPCDSKLPLRKRSAWASPCLSPTPRQSVALSSSWERAVVWSPCIQFRNPPQESAFARAAVRLGPPVLSCFANALSSHLRHSLQYSRWNQNQDRAPARRKAVSPSASSSLLQANAALRLSCSTSNCSSHKLRSLLLIFALLAHQARKEVQHGV